jgi:hypothetical protein
MPMATLHQDAVVLELAHIDELFKAPQVDPFSTREVAVFGEAGLERLRKRVIHRWPRHPRSARLILHLPPDQIAPATAADARVALRRLSAAAIGRNRLGRRKAMAAGLRQLVLACVIVVVVLPIVYLLAYQPAGVLPSFWRGILAILALFTGLVALWDAIRSLAFDWIPFAQNEAGYRYIATLEVTVEAHERPRRIGGHDAQ